MQVIKTCSVDRCEGSGPLRLGLCTAHYMRQRRYGSTELPPPAVKPVRICSVDDCERPVRTRGWCNAHYLRHCRHGSVDVILRAANGTYASICSVADCERPHHAGGFCGMHHMRVKTHGDPNAVKPKSLPGDLNPNWRGDDVGYAAVHRRLRRTRGSASTYPCAQCGKPAYQWSYDHADSAQRTDSLGLPYSIDLAHYLPRCTPCHKRFDLKVKETDL